MVRVIAVPNRIAPRPTGEAVDGRGVKARLPTEAYTVHRLLGHRPGRVSFRHDREHPLPYVLVVVDEASMLDVALATKLVEALPDDGRLILLGDKDQLSAARVCRDADRRAPQARAPVNLEQSLAGACEGVAITPEVFRSLLSREDLDDIEAGGIHRKTLGAYALSFAEGVRSGRIGAPVHVLEGAKPGPRLGQHHHHRGRATLWAGPTPMARWSGVKYVKRNFLPGRHFRDPTDFNEQSEPALASPSRPVHTSEG